MRRILTAVAVLVAVGGFIPPADAVCVDETAHYIKRGYHRNVAWPWPYVCADRVAVREPFCLMINNGWRRQNLLGPHHFNAKADKLTSAGELRVHWIMTQAPEERRAIFVERDLDPAVTAQRLATARDYAAQVTLGAQSPQVLESHLVSEGRPASVVDATNVRFQESMPAPTLPAATLSIGESQ
jgi:hypothetical protein